MEKDSGFRFHQQHVHPISPNPNLLGYTFHTGRLKSQPVHRNQYLIGDSTLETVPFCPVSQLKPWKTNEQNTSSNWFNGIPHSHEAITPLAKEKLMTGPMTSTLPSQKRFLVFDKSGDKTTLIYNSGVENAVQRGTYWIPTPPTTYDLIKDEPSDSVYNFSPINDKLSDDEKDEMREDTEELNALLYSDNDSYLSEDDEETSTGHSPSTMTDNGAKDSDEETGEEEVISSFGSSKRQKLQNGSSVKNSVLFDLEDDAVSSTGTTCNEKDMENITPGGKRTRRESINETVSILQSIIPNANGKDTIVVIDEAIRYLKSLKVKAMALGLD